MQKVKDYMKTNIFSADVGDNEFLKAYGNYLDDGKSAGRALSVINDFIKDYNGKIKGFT